jgi:uncharacterized protein YfaT (DUF1175 family)
VAGLLLIPVVSLAWRLVGLTPGVAGGEETPANQRMKAEGGRRKTTKEIMNPAASGAESARPFVADLTDSDKDGIPDGAELAASSERENFRRWFTAIAEMQFYRLSDQWNAEQRDCAGLVRFSWREALRRHDRQWFRRMGLEGYELIAADAGSITLERSPLGDRLFRTGAGPYRESDLASGMFSEFSDARSLKDFNSRFISRDRRQAQPGDLLFFFQPRARKSPFHMMIFLGEAHTASEGARDWVVYHTGAGATDAGVVKKVRLGVLDRHPDERWRPVLSNPNFLGFYRLKILD